MKEKDKALYIEKQKEEEGYDMSWANYCEHNTPEHFSFDYTEMNVWEGLRHHSTKSVLVPMTCMGAVIVLNNSEEFETKYQITISRCLVDLDDNDGSFYYEWPLCVIDIVNQALRESGILTRVPSIHPLLSAHATSLSQTLQEKSTTAIQNTETTCPDCEKAKQQQSNPEGGKLECVVCMDASSSRIFLPCHHISCCADCSKRVTNCPTCKAPIQHTHIVYIQ